MARTSQSTPRHNDRQIQILRPLQSHAYISPGSSICWHHRAVQNDLAPDLTTAGLGGWRSQALLVPPKLLDFQRASPWCRLPIAHPKSFKLSIRWFSIRFCFPTDDSKISFCSIWLFFAALRRPRLWAHPALFSGAWKLAREISFILFEFFNADHHWFLQTRWCKDLIMSFLIH